MVDEFSTTSKTSVINKARREMLLKEHYFFYGKMYIKEKFKMNVSNLFSFVI